MENNRKFLRFFDKEEYKKAVPESDQEKKKPNPYFRKNIPKMQI